MQHAMPDRRSPTLLRYVGFDQHKNIRAYRFDLLEPGQPPTHLVISANLDHFSEHRIGIQEGPNLCAAKLTADLATLQNGGHELTSEDLSTIVSERAAVEARRIELRNQTRKRTRSGSWA